MPEVKAVCNETRYIGTDRYIAGATYTVDAERAGKYREYFHPVTDTDRVEAEAAWSRRLEKMEEEVEERRTLDNLGPSILRALAVNGQDQIDALLGARLDELVSARVEKALQSKVGAAVVAAKGATA